MTSLEGGNRRFMAENPWNEMGGSNEEGKERGGKGGNMENNR